MVSVWITAVQVRESVNDNIDRASRARFAEGVADVKDFRDAVARVGGLDLAAAILLRLWLPGWVGVYGASHQG